MATLTITLPDPTSEWAEKQAEAGGYPSVDAYLGDLIERERAGEADDVLDFDWPEPPPMTIEDLRRIIAESRASGKSDKTMADIIAEGNRIAKERGFFRE